MSAVGAMLQVGVSLVLSFMVVWDFPTIAKGVQSLRSSRLRAFYTEVAPTFTVFGQLFGKALQAQVSPPVATLQRHVCCPSFLHSIYIAVCSEVCSCAMVPAKLAHTALRPIGLCCSIGEVIKLHCIVMSMHCVT